LEKYGLGENAKSKKKTHVFPTGISPVNLHHRAWVDGYVHAGQPGVQAAIQEGLSVFFTGPISDWIGPSESIAFNWRHWESRSFHL
jgi:hypothetical protein